MVGGNIGLCDRKLLAGACRLIHLVNLGFAQAARIYLAVSIIWV